MRRLMVLLLLAISVFCQPPADKATITVYREKHAVGFALKPSIYFDGVALQRLQNGTYFVTKISAGKHMITAGRSEVGLLVDFEANKQYYFRMDHRNWAGNAVSGREPIYLSQVSEEAATTGMIGLKQLNMK